MEKKNSYVIYPHPDNDEVQPYLDPKDKLIYVAIRRYMNRVTLEAYPSYATITRDTGADSKTIRKCVNNLRKEGYIDTRRQGRMIVYKFNNKNKFEPFSYEFLDKKELTFTEKSYVVASQQYMIKDPEEGKLSYSNKDLSALINMPESTISKCNRSLEKKGYLYGASDLVKRFQLRKLDQLFIYKLKDHEDRIEQNTEDINILKRQIEEQRKIIEELTNRKINTFIL